jgi:hypothetical protein
VQPSLIQSRMARRSYGIAVAKPWQERKFKGTTLQRFWHSEHKTHYADGVFKSFVAAGARACQGCPVWRGSDAVAGVATRRRRGRRGRVRRARGATN